MSKLSLTSVSPLLPLFSHCSSGNVLIDQEKRCDHLVAVAHCRLHSDGALTGCHGEEVTDSMRLGGGGLVRDEAYKSR